MMDLFKLSKGTSRCQWGGVVAGIGSGVGARNSFADLATLSSHSRTRDLAGGNGSHDAK